MMNPFFFKKNEHYKQSYSTNIKLYLDNVVNQWQVLDSDHVRSIAKCVW